MIVKFLNTIYVPNIGLMLRLQDLYAWLPKVSEKVSEFFFELFIKHTIVNCFQNASNIAKALYSIISVPIIYNNIDDVIFV